MDPTPRILEIVRRYTKNTIRVRRCSTLICDLEMDSLNRVSLIMDLEAEYSIDIPDAKIEDLRTVQDIVDHVRTVKWWSV